MKFFKVFTQDDVSDYMRIGSDKLKQFIINNSIPSLSFDQIIFPENFCDFGNMNLENVEFVKCTFKGRAIFESAQFKDANFDDAIFENDAIFRHTKLLNASFKRATFHGNTIFIDAQVTSIDFSEANFNAGIQYADIKSCAILKCNKATFRCNAAHQAISFSNIEILNGCFFSEAKFFNEVRFEKSMFSSNIYFDNADFFEKVSFNEATFKGSANFKKSKFYNDAYFQIETASNGMIFINSIFEKESVFVNTKFNNKTDFTGAIFKNKVPSFHGSELHGNTIFHKAQFPDPTGDIENSGAYRALKLAFNKLQATREEQLFFKLEMKEESLIASRGKHDTHPPKWIYKLYGGIAGYGFNLARPSLCLFVVFALFAALYFFIGINQWQISILSPDWVLTLNLIKFNIGGIVPIPLSDNLFPSIAKMFCNDFQAGVVSILLIVEKLLSFILWFFMALALRNGFKMK